MSQIEIRSVQDSDFDQIYEFIGELENQNFDKEQLRKILSENLADPKNIYLIALLENEAVGFLSCHVQNLLHHNGLVGEIQEMFTKAEKRNLGIGQMLIDHLKMIAKDKNIIQLEVTTNVKRVPAHNFYEKQHFTNTHKKFVCKMSE